ncbi:hypothetical protein EV693_1022 [Nicoletella semolina]|uniref:Uncharacterized protein n=1 Tax=Nicoletella semolina TaxID=271160 RepID=A0A4R2NBF9_9PAST|nr:hypothetical protein EV693_1022 [Nicoletella semolina]
MTEVVKYALVIPPYTVRQDALPTFFSEVNQMYEALFNAVTTGVFTDFPDTGVTYLGK